MAQLTVTLIALTDFPLDPISRYGLGPSKMTTSAFQTMLWPGLVSTTLVSSCAST